MKISRKKIAKSRVFIELFVSTSEIKSVLAMGGLIKSCCSRNLKIIACKEICFKKFPILLNFVEICFFQL